jgi:hypothetical protein
MDAVLTLRLPTTDHKPVAVDSFVGWLSQPTNLAIKPILEVSQGRNQWAWLPNEAIARNWQEFSRTGWVTDTPAPPQPTSLQLRMRPGNQPELRWLMADDLGSGHAPLLLIKNGYGLSLTESFCFHFSSSLRKVKQNPPLFTGIPSGEAYIPMYGKATIRSIFLTNLCRTFACASNLRV